jgi:CHASE1-domain containing sensor protein
MREGKAAAFWRRPGLRRYAPVAVAACAGAALSVWLALAARSIESREIRDEMEQDAQERVAAVEHTLELDSCGVESLCAFYAGSVSVERDEFREFVAPHLAHARGVLALAWAPRVRLAERAAFEDEARGLDLGEPAAPGGFRIAEPGAGGSKVPAGRRDEYYPILYVEPAERNHALLGLDLASDPLCLAVLERARDSGELVSTERLGFLSDGRGERGFLLLQPVYRQGAAAGPVESRRADLRGFCVAVVGVGGLVKSALSDVAPVPLDLDVFDVSGPREQFLYHYVGSAGAGYAGGDRRLADARTGLHHEAEFGFGGRRWAVVGRAAQAFATPGRAWQPWAVLVAGVALTGLLAFHLLTCIGHAQRTERLVEERTVQLSRANAELHGEVEQRRKAGLRAARLNDLQASLIDRAPLAQKMKAVTDGVVSMLDADFARVWLVRPGDRCERGCLHARAAADAEICRNRHLCLHLVASSGRYTRLDGEAHRRVSFGYYKIGRLVSGPDPKALTNDLTHDPGVQNPEWARRLGLVSFAGYRLLDSRRQPVGVLALFSQHKISQEDDALLESVAHTTAQVVATASAEEALRAAYKDLETRVEERTADLTRANEALHAAKAAQAQGMVADRGGGRRGAEQRP